MNESTARLETAVGKAFTATYKAYSAAINAEHEGVAEYLWDLLRALTNVQNELALGKGKRSRPKPVAADRRLPQH